MTPDELAALGAKVIRTEAEALERTAALLNGRFAQAVRAVTEANTIYCSGIGKAYIIGNKIAASMSSVGLRATPVHPVDALHGDLGRIQGGDLALLLSNSGRSTETIELARALESREVVRIALTAEDDSPLARHCDLSLSLGRHEEADLEGIVPTSSTTAMLALGDALCVASAAFLGVDRDGFAHNHPGGSLGRRLSPLRHTMRTLERTPVVQMNAPLADALSTINQHRAGAAFVVDGEGRLQGIFTDGDLRRCVAQSNLQLETPIEGVMTVRPRAISQDAKGEDALELMRSSKIDELPVVDAENRLVGFVDILDLS